MKPYIQPLNNNWRKQVYPKEGLTFADCTDYLWATYKSPNLGHRVVQRWLCKLNKVMFVFGLIALTVLDVFVVLRGNSISRRL